ncbi:hypothetical protein BJ138DRAFT_1125650 [Hygrophoropsis aurantiaca]|uniref:Uncharacterized protein n=1 Tax=Hygrophoropsis aurantiaca TaxID=72124 RepID=A0ACB8AG39_9AGAM|nr:hypothetical protein BJ138DRAFT_1125650 [Hygrophoropsis aurantiaca]
MDVSSADPISQPSTSPIPLAAQVGGHAGVQTTEDGSLLLKPALPVEIDFYQQLSSEPVLKRLKPWTCKFFGTLQLQGTVKEGTGEGAPLEITPLDTASQDKESLVLENLTHGFIKPNILDIKLGTVLYDDAASPEKRARMERTAKETTSAETGIRLTGFQVYSNYSPDPVITPKAYGKSIKRSQLPEGITRFFPVATEAASLDSEHTQLGLPVHLLLPIIVRIHQDIGRIKAAIEAIEIRLVGASLLIIYEGDRAKAEAGQEALKLSGAAASESELEDTAEEEEIDIDDDEETDDDSEDEEEESAPLYQVKLIDFAHTRLVPGLQTDQGVMLGLQTTLELLSKRIEEVRQLAGNMEGTQKDRTEG